MGRGRRLIRPLKKKGAYMNKEIKILMIKNRIQKLKGTEKNIKCPGVLRKLHRQLRNLEGE